jgi:cytochrome P450
MPPGAEVDALAEMAKLTAEIISRTIFGSRLGHEHAEEVVSGFADYQRHIMKIDVPALLGMPDWVPRWYGPRVRAAVRRIHAVIDRIISAQRQRDTEDGSIIDSLLHAKDVDTGAPLATEAIRNEAAVLFMAGHETTANTLAWAWFIISQMPKVEARFHAEIDEVLGGRTPTLADVPKLVYTRAIIEETLRLYPPVPLLSREALVDENYKGTPIPKGSVILIFPWLLHRNGKWWPKPNQFKPERFLPGGQGPISKFAYIPFSIGPRICAGLGFAMAESVLSMAALAQNFRLRLKPVHKVEMECRLTLRPGEHLPMILERREKPQVALVAAPTPAAAAACPFGHG